jgi:hypothetical protein
VKRGFSGALKRCCCRVFPAGLLPRQLSEPFGEVVPVEGVLPGSRRGWCSCFWDVAVVLEIVGGNEMVHLHGAGARVAEGRLGCGDGLQRGQGICRVSVLGIGRAGAVGGICLEYHLGLVFCVGLEYRVRGGGVRIL